MGKFVRNYSLSIVLFILFAVSWLLQGVFQWQEFIQTQLEHGQRPEMSSFMPEFLAATFENWQSEFLQLFTFVVLTTYLIHKGSHESKDTDEQMQQSLSRIENLLKKGKKK